MTLDDYDGWYPLHLTSTVRPLVHGGHALANRLGRKDLPHWSIAEAWEICDADGAVSYVTNGRFGGVSIRDLVRTHPHALMGRSSAAEGFPLFVRLVDAAGETPCQLDRRHEPETSTQRTVWHILDAAPGATLHCGIQPGVTIEAVRRAIIDQDFDSVLREIPVRPGNTIAIPNGTLYAFGPDTVLYAAGPQLRGHHCATRWRAEDGSLVGYNEWQGEIDAIAELTDLGSRPMVHTGLPLERDSSVSGTMLYADEGVAVERWQVAAGSVRDQPLRTAAVVTNVGAATTFRAGNIEEPLERGRTTLFPAALEHLSVAGPADVLIAYVPDLDADVRRPLADAGINASVEI